jgi:hypothetical protein
MLKTILVQLGLRKAPTPVRTVAALSSLFGTLPVAAFFAWKYRDRIAAMMSRYTHASASTPVAAT